MLATIGIICLLQTVNWIHGLPVEPNSNKAEYVSLPFYGAAKGQLLEIVRNSDGVVTTKVIQSNGNVDSNQIRPTAMPSASGVPSKAPGSDFIYSELTDIQKATADILSVQDRIRLNERLTKFDQQLYIDQLNKLSNAGSQLVNAQQSVTSNGLPSRNDVPPVGDDKRNDEDDGEDDGSYHPVDEDNDDEDEDDEDVGEEPVATTPSTTTTTTTTAAPKESIAIAKPVGIAIAGVGGVASSKPVATAIVGPGGTAIASPVATAIAGLSPSDLAALGLPVQLSHKMKNHEYGFIYESSNYPFIPPAEWNSNSPAANAFSTRKIPREDVQQMPKAEAISRDQFVGDLFNNQYNLPFNPYDVYVPVYN